ncbi:hypothetical protein N7536_010294 [Penicillium majusculum]|uniref:N-acetylgalactosaminide beta-1,3-galactosyltransferase n=1 Tax=Penicillium solitum TaxID=60172 RepID=A0A1V6QAX4_9EURO|nr:uncharacterized protein PENSOL_c090G11315 [Penicillium solitum]KAJ5687675.1 hypothetical protein N7536_010294 [Penicillium majusculum]OQD86388.1 hypothetical protein PENSOL_c090G11315 [Penicillium solitum]
MDTGTSTSATARPFFRALGNAKLKLLAAFLTVSTILLLTLYSSRGLSEDISPSTKNELANEKDYWTWETSTRFRKSKYGNDLDDTESSQNATCDAFPSDMLSRIQIILKTSATEDPKRVDTHMASVTRCISNLLVISDKETELHGHRVLDILADLPPSSRNQTPEFKAYEALQRGESNVDGSAGWKLDRFKFLPMVERAKKVNPGAEWYVFLETDTYFVWDNLFRMLEQFDPLFPLYMGSPAPGRDIGDGKVNWFAYGGSGFVLSRAAVDTLVAREVGEYGQFIGQSLSEQYMQVVKDDCCGDSVLGFALYEKGIELSGMWPMFNAHPLDSIPFGDDHHWCQPAISMHKSQLGDMTGLADWEDERDRTKPLLYADLVDYPRLGQLSERKGWDNGAWGGIIEQPDTLPQHESLEACRQACHDRDWCMSYTYDTAGVCVFVRSLRLGAKSKLEIAEQFTAGWDNDKIQNWRVKNTCEQPMWMKPSLTRIF